MLLCKKNPYSFIVQVQKNNQPVTSIGSAHLPSLDKILWALLISQDKNSDVTLHIVPFNGALNYKMAINSFDKLFTHQH